MEYFRTPCLSCGPPGTDFCDKHLSSDKRPLSWTKFPPEGKGCQEYFLVELYRFLDVFVPRDRDFDYRYGMGFQVDLTFFYGENSRLNVLYRLYFNLPFLSLMIVTPIYNSVIERIKGNPRRFLRFKFHSTTFWKLATNEFISLHTKSMNALTSFSMNDSSLSLPVYKKPRIFVQEHDESSLIWKQGDGCFGSVLVCLARSGYTRDAHKIIELSHTASLVGRKSIGGLPELWDIMGKRRGQGGITRLMAVAIVSGSLSPQRARALIRDHKVDVNAVDDSGRSALHHALFRSIKATQHLNGNITYEYQDDQWRSNKPLNVELIQVLVEANPSIARQKDKFEKLPLHLICERSYPCNVIEVYKVLKLFVDQYPCGIEMGDKDGNIPLHIAVRNSAPTEVIQFLIEAFPRGASIRDSENLFPLHSALIKNASASIIRELIKAYPLAARLHDNRGVLPLHISLEMHASVEVIKLLIVANPDAKFLKTITGESCFDNINFREANHGC
jgi:hypothetical protein